jgi:hypothetical protein
MQACFATYGQDAKIGSKLTGRVSEEAVCNMACQDCKDCHDCTQLASSTERGCQRKINIIFA